MSVSITPPPRTAGLAESAGVSESAVSDEIQSDACLKLSLYFTRKALATRVLGALLLIPASPLIVLMVVLVRCTSSGPGLLRQVRVGKGGDPFTMYKIRTMHQYAEEATGPVWCKPTDSRITCVGRLLRFVHLDELPQLINIVRGEMDLIGPRPERPKIITQLVKKIPQYEERLTVLPGVTGLAQVNLPPDVSTNCVRRKLVLDLEYIDVASLGMDCRILLCTGLRMMGIRHGRAVRLLCLEYMQSEDHFHPDIELQSDIARKAMQTYLFYRDRSGDDFSFADEKCKVEDMLVHAECLRVQPDALAGEEEAGIPLSASLSGVARAYPR